MFTGVSCDKKTPHHGRYNSRLLCQNLQMSTLCRAEWNGQGNPESIRGRNGNQGLFPSYSPDNHSSDIISSAPLEISVKGGVKGDRIISDNRKYFGLFFWERDHPGRCAGRLAPHFQSQVHARPCPFSRPCQSNPANRCCGSSWQSNRAQVPCNELLTK